MTSLNLSDFNLCRLSLVRPSCTTVVSLVQSWPQRTRSTQLPYAEFQYLGEAVALLRCALRFTCGVAQGKHDGPLIEGCHVLQNLLSESSCNGCDT